MEIRGVVLDAVGTLITPRPSVAEAYAQAAQRQGVLLDVDLVKRRFAQHFGVDEATESGGPMSTDEPTEYRRWRRIVGGVLPEIPDPARAFDELWEHFGRSSSWMTYPDVAPTLADLRAAGVAVRIASNFDRRLRQVVAGLPGLDDYGEALVISSEIGIRKPHPEFYRTACAQLGLAAQNVLCVGDDPENDLQGPRRAGLRAVLIDREDRYESHRPRLSRLTDLYRQIAKEEHAL